MCRFKPLNIVCILALLISADTAVPSTGQSKSDSMPSSITVTVPLSELFDGYHSWMIRSDQKGSGSATETHQHFLIKTPSIDVYSPSGISIYHGTDAEQNTKLIEQFPGSIQNYKAPWSAEVRPTLQESIAMFSELKPYVAEFQHTKSFTIFSLQSVAKMSGTKQAEAIDQLKQRTQKLGIRVIDVRVRS